MKFTYRLSISAAGRAGAGLVLEPDGMTISTTEILMAFDRILRLQDMTGNPDQLGISNDSYLYAILLGIGLIRREGITGGCKTYLNSEGI